MTMPPYADAMGCPALKFKYGKDCICEDRVACRGLTAAFSMLGNDPRSLFVRLPNYKESPTSQYYIERNQQREAYLRYLLPNHPVEKEVGGKDVALHHFHPRVVARLVSKLQKNIPRTMSEKELRRLKLKPHERDRILDEDGNPTGQCIFAPNYPMSKSKEDLKRLLRLCRTLNQVSKENEAPREKSSSPKTTRKRGRRKFDPDIRSEGDLVVGSRGADSDDPNERATTGAEVDEEVDSLAEHNIHSLLESIIRLEPITEEESEPIAEEESAIDKLKVETTTTEETELESVFSAEEEASSVVHKTASVSMQIRLEKLHTGKGKNRMSKVMNKAPSPFFEISVLHQQQDHSLDREIIYRSYPLTDTKNATWDPIESLQLNVDVHTLSDLNFRITVHDCDMKGGNHLLIGASEVNALDLITTSSMSVPIRRDDKVKGFLEVSGFQLQTDERNDTLGDDDSVYSVLSTPLNSIVIESVSEDATAEALTTASVEQNIQLQHPDSPDVTPSRSTTATRSISLVNSGVALPAVTPDASQTSPAAAFAPPENHLSTTNADARTPDFMSTVEYHQHEEATMDTFSMVSAMSMPSVSMQISLEDLHTGKGRKKGLASKMLHTKSPSPFFDFAVLHKDEQSTKWETVYQSYPMMNTKSGTWDTVEELNLGVLVHSSHVLCFRITVYDCDMKTGNHRLIGSADVNESTVADRALIAIQREGKIKGFLRFDRFEVDWTC